MVEEPHVFAAYEGLATPTLVLDADYRIIFANQAAMRLWGPESALLGTMPLASLRLSPPDGVELDFWRRDVVFPAIAAGDAFTCRDVAGRTLELRCVRFMHGSERRVLMTVGTPLAAATPTWALTDPLTGLHNRHQWDLEFRTRDAAGGSIVFLDLDNLKQINDLSGHRHGDQALALCGAAIRSNIPPGALAVRYGGDEFVIVLPERAAERAERLAQTITAAVEEAAVVMHSDIPLHLSHGVASFEPGELARGLEDADQALYARRGVLLASRRGGRIILTRDAQRRLLSVTGDAERATPGELGRTFGREFNAYFTEVYARSVAQAREFIDFVSPEAGSAVVEIGAGAGRMTFDGGLAERVGREGQLLVTDASPPQVQAARQRAVALGLDWLHFLVAPAEDLPVASNTVDLVVGGYFLHYTDEAATLRAAARILRPGGRLALSVGLDEHFGPAWQRAFAPIREALATYGRDWRPLFVSEARLREVTTAAGLVVEEIRQQPSSEEAGMPTVEAAMAVAEQAGMATLFARPLPERVRSATAARALAEFRRALEELGPATAWIRVGLMSLRARKPA